jgi:hypothetical protein
MNLKQRSNLLAENHQLNKQKNEMEQRIIDLTNMLEQKMSLVIEVLNAIKDKQFVVNSASISASASSTNAPIINDKPFIPSINSTDLKMSVQDLPKRSGKSKIGDSLSKLSKLQEEP